MMTEKKANIILKDIPFVTPIFYGLRLLIALIVVVGGAVSIAVVYPPSLGVVILNLLFFGGILYLDRMAAFRKNSYMYYYTYVKILQEVLRGVEKEIGRVIEDRENEHKDDK